MKSSGGIKPNINSDMKKARKQIPKGGLMKPDLSVKKDPSS